MNRDDADRDLHEAWCEATMRMVYDFAEAYCNHQCDDSKDLLKEMNVARRRIREHLRGQPASMNIDIDDRYAGRLALMLECLLLNPYGHWDAAARLLDEYRAEWDKVRRATTSGSPIEHINERAQQV